VSRMPSMPRMPLPHQIGIARAPSNVPQPSLVGRKELPVAGESEASLWKVDSSLWQMLPMERHKAVTAAAQNAQKCDVYMHEIVPSSIDCLKKATAAGQEVLQMTDTQRRVLLLVNELVSAQDWKGILARENEFRATAVALQAADPANANAIYSNLGLAHALLDVKVK